MFALFYTDSKVFPPELMGVYTTIELAEKAKLTYVSDFRDEEDFFIEEVHVDRIANLPEGKRLYCYLKNLHKEGFKGVVEQVEPFDDVDNIDFVKGEILNQVVCAPRMGAGCYKVYVWASSSDEAEELAEQVLKKRFSISKT